MGRFNDKTQRVIRHDYTVGVISRDKSGVLTVENVVRIQDRPHVVRELILRQLRQMVRMLLFQSLLTPAHKPVRGQNKSERTWEKGYTVKLTRPSKAKSESSDLSPLLQKLDFVGSESRIMGKTLFGQTRSIQVINR